jgi:hypothetical protein
MSDDMDIGGATAPDMMKIPLNVLNSINGEDIEMDTDKLKGDKMDTSNTDEKQSEEEVEMSIFNPQDFRNEFRREVQ